MYCCLSVFLFIHTQMESKMKFPIQWISWQISIRLDIISVLTSTSHKRTLFYWLCSSRCSHSMISYQKMKNTTVKSITSLIRSYVAKTGTRQNLQVTTQKPSYIRQHRLMLSINHAQRNEEKNSLLLFNIVEMKWYPQNSPTVNQKHSTHYYLYVNIFIFWFIKKGF